MQVLRDLLHLCLSLPQGIETCPCPCPCPNHRYLRCAWCFAARGSAGMVNRCEAETNISKGDRKPGCLLRALGRGATASRPRLTGPDQPFRSSLIDKTTWSRLMTEQPCRHQPHAILSGRIGSIAPPPRWPVSIHNIINIRYTIIALKKKQRDVIRYR